MTALTPIYSLVVYSEDDTTVLFEVSTDPTHPYPYLKAFDNFAEQEIDFAKGAASIGQMNVQIVDVPDDPLDQDSGFLTGLLADPTGGSQLIGHRVLATQDVGAGVETVLDGVIRSVTLLDTYATYELELRDIRERERKTRAFVRTDTPTVLPRGVLAGYGITKPLIAGGSGTVYPIPPTRPLTGQYLQRTSTQGEIHAIPMPDDAAEWAITGPMRDALEHTAPLDSAPEVEIYDRWKLLWRDKATGGAYTTVAQVAARHASLQGGGYQQLFYEGITAPGLTLDVLQINNVLSGDTLPANAQMIEFIVQYDGPVNEDWRVHLQDLTVGELLRNLYRGDYSDEDPRIRYDEAALLALNTPARLWLSEPIDNLREWAEKNAYQIVHAAPTLNAAGEISPVTYLLPDATVTLPTLSDSNCRPTGGGWRHGAEDAINVVRVKYQRDFAVPPAKSKGAQPLAMSDRIRSREVTVERHLTESIALLGERELTIESGLLRAIGGTDGGAISGDVSNEVGYHVAQRITYMVTDRFALGGQHFSLAGMRTDADVEALEVGDFVVVAPSWQPDYNAGVRGANRLAQVIGRRNIDAAWTSLTLIDAGSANAPLGQPTLGTVTVDSAGIVSIPVTALAAGSEGRVDYAISTTEPAATSELWQFLARVRYAPATPTTPPLEPGTTAWIRARGENTGRRPSAYTTPVSVAYAAVPRIIKATLSIDEDGVPSITWEANSTTLGVRLHYEVHASGALPTFGSTIDLDAVAGAYEWTTLRVMRGKTISVQVEPWTGWTGSAVSGTAGVKVEKRAVGELVPVAPWVQADFYRDAEDETATLTLVVRGGMVSAVEFSKREGSRAGDVFSAFVSTWDTAPSPPPFDGTYIESVAVPGGEDSAITWRVTFLDKDGNPQTVGSTHDTSQLDEHETQVRVHFSGGQADTAAMAANIDLVAAAVEMNAVSKTCGISIPLYLKENSEIVGFRIRGYRAASEDTCQGEIVRADSSGGKTSIVVVNVAAGGWGTAENLALSEVVSTSYSYFARAVLVTGSGGAANDARIAYAELDVIRHTQREG